MTGWLMALACGALGAGAAGGARWPRWWLALTVAGCGAALGAALAILLGSADWEWRSGIPIGGEPLHLRPGGVSAWVLV